MNEQSEDNKDNEISVEIEGMEETPIPASPVIDPAGNPPTKLEIYRPHPGSVRQIIEPRGPWEMPDPYSVRGFKINDKVILLLTESEETKAKRHSPLIDSVNGFPIWGGRCGFVGGTIISVDPSAQVVRVKWSNGIDCTFQSHISCLRHMTAEQAVLDADNEPMRREREKEERKVLRGPAPIETRPPASWTSESLINREAWLTEAAKRIATASFNVRFSTGYGKGGTRGGKDYSIIRTEDGQAQVFIRPTIHRSEEAARAILDAFCELGLAYAHVNVADWPEYPQPTVTEIVAKQKTLLIKCQCVKCGFTMRATMRWINKSPEGLYCPSKECDEGEMMIERPE